MHYFQFMAVAALRGVLRLKRLTNMFAKERKRALLSIATELAWFKYQQRGIVSSDGMSFILSSEYFMDFMNSKSIRLREAIFSSNSSLPMPIRIL